MKDRDNPQPYDIGRQERVVGDRYDHLTPVSAAIWETSFVGRVGWSVALELYHSIDAMCREKQYLIYTERSLADNMTSDATKEKYLNQFTNTVDHNNDVYSRWLINDNLHGVAIVDLYKKAVVEMHFTWWQRFVTWITRGKKTYNPTFRHWLMTMLRFWDTPSNYTDFAVDRVRIFGARGSALSPTEQVYGIPRNADPNLFERNDYDQRKEQFDRLRREWGE